MVTVSQTEISRIPTDLQSELIHELGGQSDLASFMTVVVERAANALKASACTVFTIDPCGDRATQCAGSGYQKRFNGERDVRVVPANMVPERPQPGEELGLTGWILSTGIPFLAKSQEELEAHPHHSGRYDSVQLPETNLQLQGFLGVPVRGLHGEIIGMIKAERRLPDVHDADAFAPVSFSVDDELALEAVARVASRCITYLYMVHNDQHAEAITAWARDVIAEAAATEGELDTFLDMAVKVTAAAMQADSCGIFLRDESGKTLTERAGTGSQALRKVIRAYPWPDETLIEKCVGTAECSPPTCQFREERPVEQGAYLFSPGDIRDVTALVAKLSAANEPVSAFLRGLVSPEQRQALDDSQATAEEKRLLLVTMLNGAIQKATLYEVERFASVGLSEETRALIVQEPGGKDLVRLNRLLLEDAYPKEIAKKVGLTAWIAATGKPFHARNFQELSAHCHHRGQYDPWNFPEKQTVCGAFLGIPLQVGGTIVGVVKVENTSLKGQLDPRDFTQEAQQRLEVLAQDIALAIKRLQAQIPARYHIIQEAQQTILEILRGGLDLPELVEKVVTETRDLFHAGACALFLKEGNRLIQRAASGWAKRGPETRSYQLVRAKDIKDNPSPDEKVGLTVWIAARQEKFTARSNTELTMHPHWQGKFDLYNFDKGGRCESFMGFPLVIQQERKNELVGVLKVETKKKRVGEVEEVTYFNELDEIVFDLIAKSAAIAIQNARLQKAASDATQDAWKQFSAMAAHRAGTEAAIIGGALRFLRKSLACAPQPPTIEENLDTIAKALTHMDTFVHEFTEFTKPPGLQLEQLNVNEICYQAKSSFGVGSLERINVHLQLAENLPQLWGDREKLLYAFKEIFHNALKAMREGGNLTVVTSLADHGTSIRIEFKDTGPGIAGDIRTKIFEPGYRGRSEGTGLGLAIVKTTIHQHKGTIVESGEPGKGARFVIELPVRLPATQERLLVVEDTAPLRHQIEIVLKSDSPSRLVVTASNETEAEDLLQESEFDTVITDIDLTSTGGAATGGLKVLDSALLKDSTLPVIIVTAYGKMDIPAEEGGGAASVSVEDAAKKRGCFAFIPRPYPGRDYLDVLREAVTKALEKRLTLRGTAAGGNTE